MPFVDRGEMKVTVHPAGGYKPMLPLDRNFKDCRGDNRTIHCFKAGKTAYRTLRLIAFIFNIVFMACLTDLTSVLSASARNLACSIPIPSGWSWGLRVPLRAVHTKLQISDELRQEIRN